MKKAVKSDKELTAEQYQICRQKGTEAAFSGKYHACQQTGTYQCVCCGQTLFSSADKFDSGTGWPSFSQAIAKEHVTTEQDTSQGMVRTEVQCSACSAHLGHVFPDGHESTGLRFCINSVALDLHSEE